MSSTHYTRADPGNTSESPSSTVILIIYANNKRRTDASTWAALMIGKDSLKRLTIVFRSGRALRVPLLGSPINAYSPLITAFPALLTPPVCAPLSTNALIVPDNFLTSSNTRSKAISEPLSSRGYSSEVSKRSKSNSCAAGSNPNPFTASVYKA